jgi:two-component system response regulator FixJ
MPRARAKVFVVDDDEAVRDSLKMLLESYDIEVEECSSTAEFVRRFRPRGRQCLLLDQHLPGATGLDFLASPDGIALTLPVILLTGRGDRSIRDRAYELGVRAYLEKPVADDLLIATIARAIGDGAASADT